MVYYKDFELLIRTMEEKDASIFTKEELAQGWDASIQKYQERLEDQKNGTAIALTAVYQEQPAGYISVYRQARGGPFRLSGYPELVDFSVLEKFRKHGIGNRLMDVAEQLAKGYSAFVCLGVGLHSGYGSAQRMYIKRGYLPDGFGVWYQDAVCKPYTACRNDDNLVLYLYKQL